MADLPAECVIPGLPAFTNVGEDYFGAAQSHLYVPGKQNSSSRGGQLTRHMLLC